MFLRAAIWMIVVLGFAGPLCSQMEQWTEIEFDTEINKIPPGTKRLRVSSFDDDGYPPILVRFTDVEALWIYGGIVSQSTFKLLSNLKQLKFLRVGGLDDLPDWSKAKTDIFAALPNLDTLELFGRFDIKEQGSWKFPPKLRRLALRDAGDWMTISVFRAALEPPDLEELEINPPIDWVVEASKLIGQKKGLKKLRLQGFDVDDEAACLCLSSGQIEELTLNGCDTDGSFLKALPTGSKLKALKLLYVSEFDGRNLAELAKLNRNLSLEFQSKDSVKTIARWLKPIAERVESLSLIQTSWKDADLQVFKGMKALKKLTLERCYGLDSYKSEVDTTTPQLDELVLIGEQEDLTIEVLLDILLSQGGLRVLCVNREPVLSDEVVRKVVKASPSLQQLDLRGCPNITDQVCDEIRRTQPKLKVSR
ncbi:hypothetical protein PLCT2_00812 [Planctomycetaceae bacterium]|nr:hypothetical protein PLCT2_00812 [Planctomycetaceae bacterium]